MIDLYGSTNWKSILLGTWCLKEKDLIFEKGELFEAMERVQKEGKELELRNAPWELEEFKIFWQQARLHQTIEVYGEKIKIPANFTVHTSEGYQWEALFDGVKPATQESTSSNLENHILNPTTFHQYFKNYQFLENGQLDLKPGWIENAAKEAASNKKEARLSLLLTRELSADQWGRLLTAIQKHNIKLNLQVAPGVLLPKSFPKHIKEAFEIPLAADTDKLNIKASPRLKELASAKAHVFIAEDIDYAVATLKDQHKGSTPKIIDISECEASDLLTSITPHFNKDTLNYKFTQEIKALWTALEKGQTVILKGHFKAELIDALAPLCSDQPHFWLNSERRTFPGKLILVTDNQEETQKHFSFASTTIIPTATDDSMLTLLQNDVRECYIGTFLSQKVADTIKKLSENPESKKYSFIKWQSILEHQLCYPGRPLEENWQGLYTLNESRENIPTTELTFDQKTVAESNAFEQNRLSQIHNALAFRPFVFIAGTTGAGKSTFIRQTLANYPRYKVFFENQENQLQAWATDKTPGVKKPLFIDEANIDKGNFSAYEGLFNTPPSILIKGKHYKLTAEHKIIFAGNPLSYGSREMPTLFERRGGSVIFTPLSPAYLYVKVLQPIIEDHITKKEQKVVGKALLDVYQYISRLSSNRVLISPRELQMMALLVVKKRQEEPPPTIDECIAYAVHTIGAAVVPENLKADFIQWCADKKIEKPILPPPPLPFDSATGKKSKSFVVTKSRNPAYNHILDFLSIRALKQASTANETFKYAGLGGMIFEGEPGIGKSHFVVDTLLSQGFTQAHWKAVDSESDKELAKVKDQKETSPKNIFYIMPVSMQLTEKKKLLLQAFDEGAVVIIDEINSSPMMEDLLNDLLMGIYGNKRPTHPGFMILGTQNPISMEGRIAASTALERRLFKTEFPPYEPLEMKEILLNRGLNAAKAEELVEQYRKAKKYAIANNEKPVPTFRDLLKTADLFEKAQVRKEAEILLTANLDERVQVAKEIKEAEILVPENIDEKANADVPMQLLEKIEALRVHLDEKTLAAETKSDPPLPRPMVPAFFSEKKKVDPKDNQTPQLPNKQTPGR